MDCSLVEPASTHRAGRRSHPLDAGCKSRDITCLHRPSIRQMFSKILIVLLAIDSVVLIAAVLLQSGKGGGLAASFGGVTSSADAILGTRQAGNLLTKASWWCGGIFLGLAFLISLSGS